MDADGAAAQAAVAPLWKSAGWREQGAGGGAGAPAADRSQLAAAESVLWNIGTALLVFASACAACFLSLS